MKSLTSLNDESAMALRVIDIAKLATKENVTRIEATFRKEVERLEETFKMDIIRVKKDISMEQHIARSDERFKQLILKMKLTIAGMVIILLGSVGMLIKLFFY